MNYASRFLVAAVFSAFSYSAGADNPWTDACSYPNVVDPAVQTEAQRLLGATVLVLELSELTDMGDHYVLNYAGNQLSNRSGMQICSGSVFWDAYSADTRSGRTGFLVGPNLIATAPHELSFNPTSYYYVFGFSGGGLNSQCSFNETRNIPKSNVATAVPNGTYLNTLQEGLDAAIFEVQNVPAGNPWLRLRSNGTLTTDDVLAEAGHPWSLFEKFAYGVNFVDDVNGIPEFYHFFDLEGSSGTPIYNLDHGFVEAIGAIGPEGVQTGIIGTAPNQCSYVESWYDDPNPPFAPFDPLPFPEIVNNGDIQKIATPNPQFPNTWLTPEARLTPLQDVTYVLPVGGVATPASTTYSYRTSQYGPELVYTAASAISAPAGQPQLLSNGTNLPYSDNVTAGTAVPFSVSAFVPTSLACGTYDRYLEVDEQGFTDRILHRFEVGLKEVSFSPTDLWQAYYLGSPYPTRTYTISNVRPTATDIIVTPGVYGSSMGLLTINGGSGQNFHLEPGAHQDIAVGINSSADALPIGTVYHGFVAITQADSTCGKPPIFINVDFKRGEQIPISPTGPTFLPSPTAGNTYGTPVDFDFDLSSVGSYCVGDINLDVCVWTLAGAAAAPSVMKMQLTAPSGRTGTLWDRNAAPSSYLSNDGFCTAPGEQLFHLDDSTNTPLGPQHLNYFNQQHVTGHWHLDVNSSTTNTVEAGGARLDITKGTLCTN